MSKRIVTADSTGNLGSVRESNKEENDGDESSGSGHSEEDSKLAEEEKNREIEEEIKNTKTRPMSASSHGSMPDPDNYPYPHKNPLIKAISSQRKDFSHVTNLRKEVINIIEPFRMKVLTFDDRLLMLEKTTLQMDEKIRDDESKVAHKFAQYATLTRMKHQQDELLRTIHDQSRKLDEKITQLREGNEIMTIKLKHGEEFNKSFKAVMDATTREREQFATDFDEYKNTLCDDYAMAKKDMMKALDEMKMDITKMRYSVNVQMGVNKTTEANFDSTNAQLVKSVTDIELAKMNHEEKLESMLEETRRMMGRKMYRLCDILVREFKYLNKL